LQDSLDSICNKYDENGGMSIERGAKHPRIEFFIENDGVERDYFCTLFFDPHNEEFYIESFEPDLGHDSKVVLADIEDIIDAVHESFHMYMDDDRLEEEIFVNNEQDFHDSDESGATELFEEIDVQWKTPEVTAYLQENEVEVTYQFGVVQETGDGVLKRINRIWTADEDMLKDETNFIFSREEASTIIAMIASHMDSLSTMDYHE
jgi:rubredoxin